MLGVSQPQRRSQDISFQNYKLKEYYFSKRKTSFSSYRGEMGHVSCRMLLFTKNILNQKFGNFVLKSNISILCDGETNRVRLFRHSNRSESCPVSLGFVWVLFMFFETYSPSLNSLARSF